MNEYLEWVDNQIKSIHKNPRECSFEVLYREWYNYCLFLRTNHYVFKRSHYLEHLANLCDREVPLMILNVCGKDYRMCKKLMQDVMMYPLNDLKSLKNRMDSHEIYDNFDRINSARFWLIRRTQLTEDLVDLIVENLIV